MGLIDLCQVEPLMPVLKTLIDMDNEEVLLNACSALYFLSNVSAGATQAIIEAEVCPKLVELLLYALSLNLFDAYSIFFVSFIFRKNHVLHFLFLFFWTIWDD